MNKLTRSDETEIRESLKVVLKVLQKLQEVYDAIAREMGFRYDPHDGFGGLPIIPEDQRAEPGAYSPSCYICCDPDFAARGLPLCRACPVCGGHVAADDEICDGCGMSDREWHEFVLRDDD